MCELFSTTLGFLSCHCFFSLVLLMMQQPDVVKFHTLFHLLNTYYLSRRPNFLEMMGWKPHQNVWPWVKPKPMEARFLQFVLCEQASPPYRRAVVIGLPFTPKIFCNRTGKEGNQGWANTQTLSQTHKGACHTWRAIKQCTFFRAWLNYEEWWVTSAEA